MSEESGWQLQGTAPEAYERYIVPAWMGAWAQALVEMAGVGPGKRVLDVACGTGVLARKAASLVGPDGRVVGLDVNGGMIGAARHFSKLDGIDTVQWRQGDVASTPFGDGEWEVILCQQGLQFFTDPSAALIEMARVMVPGGTLAISFWRSMERYPYFKALANVLESYLGKQSLASFYESCSLGDREKVRSLLSDAGFRDIHIRLEVKVARYPSVDEFLPGYLSATPIAAEVAAMNEADRAEMLCSITASLYDFVDDGGLAAPMECHLITARK